jgi:hypothetical protein
MVKTMLLIKCGVAIVGGLIKFSQLIMRLRNVQGNVVQGRITYLEKSYEPLLTFSYSVGGRAYHKTWSDTLDRHSKDKLRAAAGKYSIGESVPVWYAIKDPDMCCIGERINGKELIWAWARDFTGSLGRLFR